MKILLIGTNDSLKESITKGLKKANDDLRVAPVFTTELNMIGRQTKTHYYMSNEEAELSYKNDAFMWVHTSGTSSHGVTKPDMYESDIFLMNFAEFNNMANPVLQELDKDDLVMCVMDEKNKKTKEDVLEAANAFERFYEHHYLYFLEEPASFIVDTILKYMIASPEEREKIEDSLNS